MHRERPQTVTMVMGEEGREEGEGGTLLGLPELDTEVDVSATHTHTYNFCMQSSIHYLCNFIFNKSTEREFQYRQSFHTLYNTAGSDPVQHCSQQTDLNGGYCGGREDHEKEIQTPLHLFL